MEIPERVDITMSDTDDRAPIRLLGARGQAHVGGEGQDGYVFVLDAGGRHHVRLDGRGGGIYAGGAGADGRLFLRRTVEGEDRVTMRLDGARGNIRAGGSGCDGDLLLFPEEVPDIGRDEAATIWLDSRYGNIALGGNGKDGDLLVLPATAPMSTTADANASIWLNGDPGDIHLRGGLKPRGHPVAATDQRGYSTDEGAVATFLGSARYGVVAFTHEHPEASGDREKLRNIRIYCSLLNENSIVHATSHAGGPCVPQVYHLSGDATDRSGWCIDLHMIEKVRPGRNVRIVYWIMN